MIASVPVRRALHAERGASSPISLVVLAVLFIAVGLVVAGVRNVSGGEVGVSVNNLTRNVALEDRVGLHFTVPYVVSFYTLDKTDKTLAMLSDPPAAADGQKPAPDFLNIKSKEGDNVKVDIKVTYRIIPEKAVDVLRTTGTAVLANSGIVRTWVRPAVRGAVMERFNELTREEMNEGDKRREKAQAALEDVNRKYGEKYGIQISSLSVENPISYLEYEQIVRTRKDTDQEIKAIIEQQGTEREAQKKRETEEKAKYVVAVSATEAEAARFIDEANARAEETLRAADTDYARLTSEAVSKFKDSEATALGRRRQAEADFEGTRQLVAALSGNGGAALVSAEFAKRLKDMSIVATPFVYNGMVQPFLWEQGTGGKAVPLPGAAQPTNPIIAPNPGLPVLK